MIGRWLFLRDGRPPAGALAGIAALFVVFLVLLFPLRQALDLADAADHGISARAVEGPAWGGRIGDLRVGPLPLGTVDAAVRPLPLLMLRGEFAVARDDGVPFSAILSGGSDRVVLREVKGTVPLPEGLGGLPVSAIGFDGFRFEAEGGSCTAAEGTVSLTLAPLSPLMNGDLVLGGKARCENGRLVVPMTGPTGMESLTLRIGGDGRWTADLALRGLPPEVSGPLLMQGFASRGDAIGVTATGKF